MLKGMYVIAVVSHTLHCWKPCSCWDVRQQTFVSELGRLGGPGRSTIKQMSVWYWFALRWQFLSLSEQLQLFSVKKKYSVGQQWDESTNGLHLCPPPHLKNPKKVPFFGFLRWGVKWQRGRGGGGGGVRDVNHKPATSAGKWMALICISSCMIHQHHFTTVQNITFILQMLIYDKQLIWETSDLRSTKDIYFLLSEEVECVCVS